MKGASKRVRGGSDTSIFTAPQKGTSRTKCMFALPFNHELTCEHSMQNLQHTENESDQCLALKEQRLREIFRNLGSVIVAYSGGVDSSYIAYVATAELGPRAVCITGQSASLPSFQQAAIDRVVSEDRKSVV